VLKLAIKFMKFPFKCVQNHEFDFKAFSNRTPNIIHFVFALKEQTEPFSFIHYLSVYSAYLVNKPLSIYLHHHHTIYGKWWDRLCIDVSILIINKIEIPTHIGNKKIIHTAHIADKARMDILLEKGGVYMDIDTISCRPYAHLLENHTTLCKQYMLRYKHTDYGVFSTPYIGGICNAIMLTKPNSSFFKLWMSRYEKAFNPTGWEEASIWLPLLLANEQPSIVTVLEPDTFNVPCCWEGRKMFVDTIEAIPKDLLTLHLCETMSKQYVESVTGWGWMDENPNTLYARIMKPLYLKCIISNNCYGGQYYHRKNRIYNTPFTGMFMHAHCYIRLLENYKVYMSTEPVRCEKSKYGMIQRGCVLSLHDVELHYVHDSDVEKCIEKWTRRKGRMYSKEDCDIKLCDRDHFDDQLAKRFGELKGYKSKTLFVSNKFKHITYLESVDIIHIDLDQMPDGCVLESTHPL